jgi:uncharacterized protein YlxP (DUF503 family)
MIARVRRRDDVQIGFRRRPFVVVGLCTIQLSLPGHRSLKDKRSALKPLIAWMRREFNVSVAEVGGQDTWQSATLGVAAVSTDQGYVSGLFEKVIRGIEQQRPDLYIVDWRVEML